MKLFPLAALIRLYELLKNSRGSFNPLLTRASISKHLNNRLDALIFHALFKRLSDFFPSISLTIFFFLLLSSLVLFFLSTNTNIWWRMTGSNRRPPACKAGALPAELIPQVSLGWLVVGLVGLEPTTPALSRRCSNQLSYRPGRSL